MYLGRAVLALLLLAGKSIESTISQAGVDERNSNDTVDVAVEEAEDLYVEIIDDAGRKEEDTIVVRVSTAEAPVPPPPTPLPGLLYPRESESREASVAHVCSCLFPFQVSMIKL